MVTLTGMAKDAPGPRAAEQATVSVHAIPPRKNNVPAIAICLRRVSGL
jgi:hypothetical protein